MRYDFLIETYETERVKVISAWSIFRDDDLPVRPNARDRRGRSLHEHMVHQRVSEDVWFQTMPGIEVGAPNERETQQIRPLPLCSVVRDLLRSYRVLPRKAPHAPAP